MSLTIVLWALFTVEIVRLASELISLFTNKIVYARNIEFYREEISTLKIALKQWKDCAHEFKERWMEDRYKTATAENKET